MKTEFVDLSETRKSLAVEIPGDVVDAEIDRVAKSYSRRAKIPGFRPGKVPAALLKKRFREQILHDVAHDLIPRAIDTALSERGLEPVDTPDVKDVSLEEGRALTFTAIFETLPPIDPGPYDTISLRRPPAVLDADAVDRALSQLQVRAARYEPVEGRGIEQGDTVTLDIARQDSALRQAQGVLSLSKHAGQPSQPQEATVEIGGKANPPGFDDQIKGLEAGAEKDFAIHYPADYAITELADTDVNYAVKVKDIRKRVLPLLDDEFAKDIGDFQTLDALRERIRADLLQGADADADQRLHADLLKELASRVPVALPEPLIERELSRRIEEFTQRLMDQQVDPRKANIDWEAFRDSQRSASQDAVKSALVLDEIARRENLTVTDEDIQKDVEKYAERTGRTPAAMRARLEKEGALSRLAAGLRREKTVDFVLSRAHVVRD
jgi:trigger factor